MSVSLSPAIRAKVLPFVKYGRLPLTSGAIKRAFENNGNFEDPVILQLNNFRWTNEVPGACARGQLFDGSHFYKYFFFSNNLIAQLKEDNVVGKTNELGKGGEIMLVSKAHFAFDLQTKTGAVIFLLDEYSPLARGKALMDVEGVEHKGTPEAIESLRNIHLTNTCFIPWIETASTISNPPAGPSTSRLPPPVRLTSNGDRRSTPIMAVTPYSISWRICGKCTATEFRDTKNGDKMFRFLLTDAQGTEILIVAFRDDAHRAHDLIQENCVYYVSNGNINSTKKQYNTSRNDYEIILRADSEITPCFDVDIVLPPFSLNVCPIDRIINYTEGPPVDILAVIDGVKPTKHFISRDGKELTKKEISLIDQTSTVVQFTLWNDQARNFGDDVMGQAIGIKAAFVKEYYGKIYLSSIFGTKWVISPNLPEVPALCEWFLNQRHQVETKILATSPTGSQQDRTIQTMIGPAIALRLGNERDGFIGKVFQVKARINFIRDKRALYQACIHCKSKVVETESGFHCSRCNISSDNFKWRYNVHMEISDATGSIWVTLFEDAAAKLFGKTSEQLGELREAHNEEYQKIFDEVRSKNFMFRIEAKLETYNGTVRTQYEVLDSEDVQWDRYISILEESIETLSRV